MRQSPFPKPLVVGIFPSPVPGLHVWSLPNRRGAKCIRNGCGDRNWSKHIVRHPPLPLGPRRPKAVFSGSVFFGRANGACGLTDLFRLFVKTCLFTEVQTAKECKKAVAAPPNQNSPNQKVLGPPGCLSNLPSPPQSKQTRQTKFNFHFFPTTQGGPT